MKNFSFDGVTGSVIHDKRLKKEAEKHHVRYQLIYKRKVTHFSSGISLTDEEWKNINDTTKKAPRLKELRELINIGFDKIEFHVKELIKNGGFSFDALNKRLGKGTTDNIFTTYETKITALREAGQIGTSDWYKYSKKSILNYTQKNLRFTDITIDWLKKYEKWLLDKGKSYTTISMYLRALQAIINEGKEQGYINQSQYPFGKGKYEIPTGNGRKLALTLAQIGKVMEYPLTSQTELRCRDLWLFSYLCNGINMVDLLKLKYSDISNGEISFYRQKTIRKTKNKKKIAAPLLPQMEAIINKWGNPDRKQSNFIFPFMEDGISPIDEQRITKNVTRLINKKMNDIGEALNIGNISTYTARHSFATVLKRSGANIAFISESLGHTDLDTTENYLASFEKEERLKNASLLTNFNQTE